MSSDEAFVVQVVEAIDQIRLEAVIVGNVAALLQGAPVTTQDLDLLVRDTPSNRKKIHELGNLMGARAREISPLATGLRIDATSGTIDLLFDRIAGHLSFEALRSRSIRVPVAGRVATVATLEDVIASKEAANRPKDLAQLPILRDTLRVKKALEQG
jgi:hypothetical protein